MAAAIIKRRLRCSSHRIFGLLSNSEVSLIYTTFMHLSILFIRGFKMLLVSKNIFTLQTGSNDKTNIKQVVSFHGLHKQLKTFFDPHKVFCAIQK